MYGVLMLLISSRLATDQVDREEADRRAQEVVLAAYRDTASKKSNQVFDAALKNYSREFPHVAKEVAACAVAYILASFVG
jgi:hypothetical protein